MTLQPGLRKFVLFAHVTSSVGLLGAVVCFLVLAVSGLSGLNDQTERADYIAMNSLAELVIVPLAFASLLIGILSSLGTQWGLIRYYWVAAKLLLTVLTIIVLLFQMHSIGQLAAMAEERTISSGDLGLQTRVVIHAAGGLIVLLIISALSVFKPKGITSYGQRKLIQ